LNKKSYDERTTRQRAFWRANVALLVKLLLVWFLVSFGAGIVFAEPLNAYNFLGFPLGFWFAQQGSIYVFVILIFVYARKVSQLEDIYRQGSKRDTTDDGEPS